MLNQVVSKALTRPDRRHHGRPHLGVSPRPSRRPGRLHDREPDRHQPQFGHLRQPHHRHECGRLCVCAVVIGNNYSVGDAFSGSYTFDPLTPNTGSGFGRYALTAYSVTVGNLAFTTTGTTIQISDGFADSYQVVTQLGPGVSISGTAASLATAVDLTTARLQLRDPTATVFNSFALPLTPPPLGAFPLTPSGNFFRLNYGTPPGSAEARGWGKVEGPVTSLTCVAGCVP